MLAAIVNQGRGYHYFRVRFSPDETRMLSSRLNGVRPKLSFSGDLQRGLCLWFAGTGGLALQQIPGKPVGYYQAFINAARVASSDRSMGDSELSYQVQKHDDMTRFFIPRDSRFVPPRVSQKQPTITTSLGPRGFEPAPLKEGPPPAPPPAPSSNGHSDAEALFAKNLVDEDEAGVTREPPMPTPAPEPPEPVAAPTTPLAVPTGAEMVAVTPILTASERGEIKAAIDILNELAAKAGNLLALRIVEGRVRGVIREVQVVEHEL